MTRKVNIAALNAQDHARFYRKKLKESNEHLEEAVSLIKTLKQDAEMALSDDWDRGNDGFQAQIDSIDGFLVTLPENSKI